MPALIDKVTDIAKKLRKTAKKVNDPTLQELITDLSLSIADLRVELAEQRQGTADTLDTTLTANTTETNGTTGTTRTTTTRTRDLDVEAASTRASTLSLGSTTTQLPDIGELRKFPD